MPSRRLSASSPCPTLSVVIGMTLPIANLRSRAWAAPLLLAGVLYAAIGVFALGVALDWGLFVAAALLWTALAETRTWRPLRRARPSGGPGPRALGQNV